jgi:NAD(P)-dependent dehydrogenase (short-subunit alcohol dehydrogenase family)
MNGKAILDLKPDEVEKNFRVNLLSHFYTIRAFLPGMLEDERGTIVTVASVLGHLGAANLCKCITR